MLAENPLMFPQVMTLKEASSLLKIPHSNLYKFLKTGELPSYKLGARRYITGKGATDFIRHLEQKTADQA